MDFVVKLTDNLTFIKFREYFRIRKVLKCHMVKKVILLLCVGLVGWFSTASRPFCWRLVGLLFDQNCILFNVCRQRALHELNSEYYHPVYEEAEPVTFTKAVHSAGIRSPVESGRTGSMNGGNSADICIYKTVKRTVVGTMYRSVCGKIR